MKLNIEIKKGLGDIQFDMPIEDVVSILGEAAEVESIDNAIDEITTVLHYNDDGVTLFFEGPTPTLQCIDISCDEATLFGEHIFDLGEKDLVKLLIKNNYCAQDIENEDWGERRISFNEGNIDFFFENDILMSVVYGR